MDKTADYQNTARECAKSAVNAPGPRCDLPDASGATLVPALPITLAELRSYAIKRRRQELARLTARPKGADKAADKKSRQNSNKQVNQLSSLIKKITKVAPQGPNTPASIALENAKGWVEAEAKKGNRKYRQELKRLEGYAIDLGSFPNGSGDTSDGLPVADSRRFGDALAAAINNSNHTKNSLAVKLGINGPKLSKWINFTNIPCKNLITFSQVRAIEIELNLAEGELTSLLRPAPRQIEFPPEIPNKYNLRRRLLKIIGNITHLSDEQIREKLSIAYAEYKKCKLPNYGLGKRPELWTAKGAHYLCEEFGLFASLIRDPSEPRPDLTNDETEHGQDDDEHYDDDVIRIPGKKRRKGSLESDANYFGQLFGFARRWIATPALSTAYAVNIKLTERFIQFKKKRRKARGEVELLTRRDTRAILVLIQFLHLLEKKPDYSSRYLATEGLVTESEASDARKNWPRTCRRAREKLRKIYDDEKLNFAPRKNDEDGVEGILRDKEPLNALFAIADTLKTELDKLPLLADCKLDSMKRRRATLLRDFFVMMVVLIPSAFRPGTSWRLTWQVDEKGKPSGSLRHATSEDGKATVFQLVVPRLDFKNHRSDILERGFRRKIFSIVDARGYDYIDEYLSQARQLLVGRAKTDALIVRSERFPRHTARSFSEYVCRLTSRIMTQFPRDEYHGATRISSNQIRKILATSIYNGTESMEEAEKAIASREAPVYTHIPAEKLSENSEQHIDKVAQEWSENKAAA